MRYWVIEHKTLRYWTWDRDIKNKISNIRYQKFRILNMRYWDIEHEILRYWTCRDLDTEIVKYWTIWTWDTELVSYNWDNEHEISNMWYYDT